MALANGEMASRIRGPDRATTQLETIAGWSPPLSPMVELVPASPQNSALVCGSELTLFNVLLNQATRTPSTKLIEAAKKSQTSRIPIRYSDGKLDRFPPEHV